MARNYSKEEHAFKKFNRDLKQGDFPAVIFMFGAEDYLISWAVDSLVRRYVSPSAITFDYAKLNEDGLDVGTILEACNTFSMFSEKRIVWVKEFPLLNSVKPKGYTESDAEKLISYTNNPSEGTILIFSNAEPEGKSPLVKELKKNCKTYDFCKLDEPQLLAFAEKRFNSAGVTISRTTLHYLIDETGYFNKEADYHISNLTNDIEKIIAYSDSGIISERDISETLHGDLDTFIFNFLDAVSAQKKDVAFQLLHNILANGTGVFSVLALLVSHFELLLEVKEFRQDGFGLAQIVSTMKLHEYRAKKAISFADKFTVKKIKQILIQLYEIDRNIKTGALEETLALELLVGRI